MWQREQPLSFGERGEGVRFRIDEHVPVIERGNQANVPRLRHSAAEPFPGRSDYPDDREIILSRVEAQLMEMPFDALP